jgi:hypothetical protein
VTPLSGSGISDVCHKQEILKAGAVLGGDDQSLKVRVTN